MKRHASMNRVYRLVWSQVLNTWVAVAETARGRGKGGRRLRLLSVALLLGIPTAQAAPQGGQVTSGSGSVVQSGTVTTIQQNSQHLSLNWQSFNVSAQETVNFLQPAANAIAVNRILDSNGSRILGQINANGQVWLINPNGILFGQGAQVNVGGLVASTLATADPSAEPGVHRFGGKGSGSIVNQGTLTAAPGGYIALLGQTVSNQGVITARLGTVALAAGNATTLTFNNNHLVHLQVDDNTLDALAENRQLIRADGGQVIMNAGARNSLLASVVNNTGVIEARTVEERNGTILLLGGMRRGTVRVGGTLDASAPDGGAGGFIETSGHQLTVANEARVTTAAARGLTGTWLIDPNDYTVAASGGNQTGAQLGASLATTNVTLFSSSGSAGVGNININDAVTWGANHILTLTASNNVNVNATITATGTMAGLAITPNTANGGEAASGTGTFNLGMGAAINLPNVSPSSSTALVIGGVPYTVINSLGTPGSVSATDLQGINGNLSGHYALGSNIEAVATSAWNNGSGFTPIGPGVFNFSNQTFSGTPFLGTLDGLGHKISNLTINTLHVNSNVGLFGVLGASGNVRNIGITSSSVSGYDNVGILAGANLGSITNSYTSGAVTAANSYAGGLVGNNRGAINSSYSAASLSGLPGVLCIGGLVGINGDTGIVAGSHASGNIAADLTHYAGGLIGSNAGAVIYSYATGNITGTSDTAGGLAGYSRGTIDTSFARGNVNGVSGSHIGGLVGWNYGEINNAFSTGDTTGNQYVGGLTGQNGGAIPTGTITNSFAIGRVTGQSYIGGLVGQNYLDISNSYATGSVSGHATVGGLVGRSLSGLISYGFATGNVSGVSNYVGGLVGYSEKTDISNAFATGNVSAGTGVVGGLIGWFGYGTATNTHATGTVTSRGNYDHAGGLLGVNYKASVSNSYATGNIDSAGNNVGGLIGTNDNNARLSNSFATGTVRGVNNVGGLIGNNNWGFVSTSYATGNVISGGNNAGGLAGNNPFPSQIIYSYATGNILAGSTSSNVGGLAGTNGGEIDYSYTSSYISANAGSSSVGGLVGWNNKNGEATAIIVGSYWNSSKNPTLPGVATGPGSGAVALTSDQFHTAASFSGFNFTTTPGSPGNNWVIIDSDGTLNNSGGATGSTLPMLASEYSNNIYNTHQLQLISMDLGASYTLINNINASTTGGGTDVWGTAGFTPIGGTTPFTGKLDGLGYSVSNLVINRPDRGLVGLFATTGASSIIQNLTLSGGGVSGGSAVGSLVGDSSGTITNVKSDLAVIGNTSSFGIFLGGVGGLVGTNWGSITDSSATGALSGSGGFFLPGRTDIGGLVGTNGGIITRSFASGAVNGAGNAGGLVGFNSGSLSNVFATGPVVGTGSFVGGLVGSSDGSISLAYAVGSVGGAGGIVGGLVGYNGGTVSNSHSSGAINGTGFSTDSVGGLIGDNHGNISNSYATGTVSSSGFGVGGLIGSNYGTATVSNTYARGTVSGAGSVGGLIGANRGVVNSSYWDIATSGQASAVGSQVSGTVTATGLTSLQMRTASNYVGFNFTTTPGAVGNNWVMVDANGSLNNAGGAAGGATPMLASEYATTIGSTHQLQLMAMAPSASYTLATNLNASGTAGGDIWSSSGFIPVGNSTTGFTGTFNGAGYAISNLTINQPSASFIGLFGYNRGAVSNVTLTQAAISGGVGAAALAGINFGTISQSSSSGSVSGTNFVGGLAGYSLGTIQSQSSSSATVNGTIYVGGLVGYNSGTVQSQSSSSGNVSGTTYVGGLIGGNAGTGIIDHVSSTASVTGAVGGFWSGGLVGLNFGSIASSSVTGQIAGRLGSGGLTGFNDGTITQSTAGGNVAGSNYVGGMAGYNTGTIQTQSSSSASVSGTNYIGGLVGYNSGAIQTQSSSSGTVSGTSYVGGLVGGNDGHGTLNQVSSTANVTVSGGGFWSGGLVGLSFGTITASSASGVLSGNLGVGGLAGLNVGTITQSTSGGSVSGSTYSGGLVGYNAGTIQTQSSSSTTVTGVTYTGGLVGYNSGTIQSRSSSSGLVTGTNFSGGLVGRNDNTGTISQSSSSSRLTGNPSSAWMGGLVGINSGSVTTSSASGQIAGTTGVGGLAGFNAGTIAQSRSTGNVTGSAYVGGLVAYNSGVVNQSFSNGSVSGSSNTGGLIGANVGGSVSADSFWDKTTSGKTTSAAGTGLTTAQAQSQSYLTNLGYVFTGGSPVWVISNGTAYPRLSWQ